MTKQRIAWTDLQIADAVIHINSNTMYIVVDKHKRKTDWVRWVVVTDTYSYMSDQYSRLLNDEIDSAYFILRHDEQN